MATLTVNGQRVKVDDSFLSLPPDQQEATVNEIAASLGSDGPKKLTGSVAPQGSSGVVSQNVGFAEGQAPTAQSEYDRRLGAIRRDYYPNVDDAKWAEIAKRDFAPYDSGGLLNAGLTFGMNDEASGASAGLAAFLSGQDAGKAFDDFMKMERDRQKLGAEQQGALGTVSEIGGAVLAGRPDMAATRAAGLLPAMLESGKAAAIQGGLYGAATAEGGLQDRATGALKGAALSTPIGVAVPAVGSGIGKVLGGGAQNRAINAAVANAPTSSELRSASSQLFQAVDNAGVTVEPQRFGRAVSDLVQEAKKMRINPTLDPKAVGAFQELVAAAKDVIAGKPMTLSELHNLRQIAQKAATSAEGRDSMFANKIIDMLDDFVTKPGSTVGPAGAASGNELLKAISTWGRARRVQLVESAIERAKNTASGFENGLRVEFRKLINNPKTAKLFTALEREEIQRVVRGTTGANLMKLIGKFGFGSGNASNMLGGSIGTILGGSIGSPLGPVGSAIGAGIAGGGATLARNASERMTGAAAERAARVVATPGITIPARAQIPTIGPLTDAAQALGRAGNVLRVRGGF